MNHLKTFCVDMDGNGYEEIFDSNLHISKLKEARGYNACTGVTLKDGTLYYKLNECIYAWNLENRRLERITAGDTCVGSWAVKDEYVYFNERYNDTFTIFRTNMKDGETEIVLGNGKTKEKNKEYSDVYYNSFLFIEDAMYIETRNPFGIVEYKDGKETQVVNNEEQGLVYDMCEYDGIIYYSYYMDGAYILMSYNPESGDIKKITDDMSSSAISFANGYVYYYREVKSLEEHMMVDQITCKKLD